MSSPKFAPSPSPQAAKQNGRQAEGEEHKKPSKQTFVLQGKKSDILGSFIWFRQKHKTIDAPTIPPHICAKQEFPVNASPEYFQKRNRTFVRNRLK